MKNDNNGKWVDLTITIPEEMEQSLIDVVKALNEKGYKNMDISSLIMNVYMHWLVEQNYQIEEAMKGENKGDA